MKFTHFQLLQGRITTRNGAIAAGTCHGKLNVKKAKADQEKVKIENQTKILNAEVDTQAVKIKAEGEAAANQVLAKSLTTELGEYNKVQKWNGANPITVLGNGTSTMVTVK